ncbi:MAG TPA: PQQ-dependent sugar dehydrogenase [Solirubrobacterales bacterium]|nr:PQQ-dependent sugar dehydrogenase [Solirubrobacterales bacterium]
MRSRKASRASTAAAALAATLTLALPACGSASDQDSLPRGEAAASANQGVALRRIGTFDGPVGVTAAAGFPKLLFVVEQEGRIRVVSGGKKLARPFLDIRGLVGFGGERGLLSLAFAPDYASSKRFYVYYTDGAGNIQVDEFRRRTATRAAFGSRRPVITIPHPVNANHNGGDLHFLGNLLFFGTGDGGSGGDPPNNAQNKEVLLGKLLRIDPRASDGSPYSVPADNPFVGKPGRDEIYSYGLRNPFRFSFDTTHGQPRIAIGDVGQDEVEELDYTTVAAAGGANFGWDAFEGFGAYDGANSGTPDPGGTVKPIFAYPHSRGGSCSIIGGYVVRDPRLRGLRGRYLYADLCEGQLRSLVPHLKRASGDRRLGLRVPSPTSFGEDQRGRLYVTSLEGPVFRLVPR